MVDSGLYESKEEADKREEVLQRIRQVNASSHNVYAYASEVRLNSQCQLDLTVSMVKVLLLCSPNCCNLWGTICIISFVKFNIANVILMVPFQIVREWVKQLTRIRGYSDQMVEDANAVILTFGSYRLGVCLITFMVLYFLWL